MSENFKVPVTIINSIIPHMNAHSLEVAQVFGFQVVIQKGKFKVGDKVIYIPIDSILESSLENHLFPPDSKIKLHHNRVRQIRIRGFASQGMLIDPNDPKIRELLGLSDPTWQVSIGDDVAPDLGVTKYEPPAPKNSHSNKPGGRKVRRLENPSFHQYNGLTNIKWNPEFFNHPDHNKVVIQEKLHGTNVRMAYLPTAANTKWKKVLKFFRLLPKYEICYGSNQVQLQDKTYTGFYDDNVYFKALKAAGAFDGKVKQNETIYGEIIGPKIQNNYTYGKTSPHFVLFDVKVLNPETGEHTWLNPDQVEAYASERGFDFVPVLFAGEWNIDLLALLESGASKYDPNQKVREGIVIKSRYKYDVCGNKMAYKHLNPDYLDDKSNTDNH